MTIHLHIEGLAGLVLAVQDLVKEVRITNTRATCPVEVLDGKDPAVQNALGITPKSTRWTPFEENLLIHGYSMNWTPLKISQELAKCGYDRTPEKCIGHMYEIRKRRK